MKTITPDPIVLKTNLFFSITKKKYSKKYNSEKLLLIRTGGNNL